MNKIQKDLYENFEVGTIIGKTELESFVRKHYPDISPISLAWRLFDLKNAGFVQDLGKMKFKIVEKNDTRLFGMKIDSMTLDFLIHYNGKISNDHQEMYGLDPRISIWETSVLNQFMVHQIYKNYIIIELDESRIDNLFFQMKESFSNVVPLRKIKGFDYFSYLLENVIIIQKLPKRSPLYADKKNNNVSIPKPEKILVDTLVINDDFLNIDETEIGNIYKRMIGEYRISITTLLAYARIRGPIVRNKVEKILDEIGIYSHD